jgi:serine/threonine protein kinase
VEKIKYVEENLDKAEPMNIKYSTNEIYVLENKYILKKMNISNFDEVEIHSMNDHKNIVKCFGHIERDQVRYIVTEFCEKGDLLMSDHSKQRENIIPIMKQIVQALIFLHSEGFAHRDIKLDNIFVSEDNTVKLGDFGLATSSDFESPVGTYSYMCPQMKMKARYSTKCDVWSLGVLFFVLINDIDSQRSISLLNDLQKIKLFDSSTETSIKNRMQNLDFSNDLSQNIKSLIMKMLEFREEDRIDIEEIYNQLILLEI